MDLKAQASATEASGSEAASTLARTKSLAASGYQTTVAVERAERDAEVAVQTQRSFNHRLFAIEVELEAARRGEYVGNSYNDRPSSLQHADDLSIRVAETESELNALDQRLAKLHEALDAEASRYSELSNAVLSSPIDGKVWEVMVSPGEEVRKGQDLLRLLDCSGVLVSVTVRESVFDRLRIGDNAQFRFFGQSGIYNGTIVRMSGSAAPPDNLAIQPKRYLPGDIGSLCRYPISRRHNAESVAPERWYSTPVGWLERNLAVASRGDFVLPARALDRHARLFQAIAPALIAVGLSSLILPWANRENSWVRLTLVAISLIVTWNYLLWRITQTLPQSVSRRIGFLE